MTDYVVSSGNADTGFDLLSGDIMTVLSSGISDDNVVSSGGRLLINSGGFSYSDTVLKDGLEVVSSGATGSDITVSSGGTLRGGGMLAGKTDVFGLISGVTIGQTTVASMYVESLGVASSVTVNDSFAYVLSGGTTRNLIADDAALTINIGASTTGTVLEGGTTEGDYGSARGTVVSNGAGEYVLSGGLATSAIATGSAGARG